MARACPAIITCMMKRDEDAFGRMLLEQYYDGEPAAEIVERDDGYIDTGSDPGTYYQPYSQWLPSERRAMRYARGRVLDIGCGAGRHTLYLQERGLDVLGIDISPLAIKTCRLRGLKNAKVASITDITPRWGTFDTVIMLGNNFGL